MTVVRSFRRTVGIASIAALLTAGLIAPPAQASWHSEPAPAPAAPVANLTVTYDPNGGTCTAKFSTGTTQAQGAEYLLPTAGECTRAGYTLAGWASSNTAAAPDSTPGASVRLDKTTTLYAVWSRNNDVNIVTYISDLTSSPACTEVVELGANATLSTVAKCSIERRLVGWNTESDFTGTQYYAPSAVWPQESFKLDGVGQSVSLYAQWGTNCPTVVGKKTTPAATEGVQWAGCDLTGAYLRGANLQKADLAGANLTDANLTDANLNGANLTGAFLKGADLEDAGLNGAILTGAFLVNADLEGADLEGADLTGANLKGAELTNVYLTDADLRLVSSGKIKYGLSQRPLSTDNYMPLPKKYQIKYGYIIGPDVDLTGAKLNYADLEDADLNNADLTGAKLKGAKLTGAILNGAKLNNADLKGADLTGAKLNNADLTGADLKRADLEDAKLKGAKLTGARLTGAKLNNATLSEVSSGSITGKPSGLPEDGVYRISGGYIIGPDMNLSGADLRYADLTYADLEGADLSGADLSGADLTGADLKRAILIDADLISARLIRAFLSGANLTGADLFGAFLSGAKLINANLIDANLSGANLTGADLTGAFLTGVTWSNTTCPGGTLVTLGGC